MTQTAQEAALRILEEIKKANKILLHCHPTPDEDSVGSVLAMHAALREMGKEVTAISGDTAIPSEFKIFPGVDVIIEKSFYEMPLEQFDLFISLDSASLRMITRKEGIMPPTLKVITIDHHSSNPGYGSINCIDSSFSSTTHLLYDLFNVWGIPVSPAMAICLLAGIYGDTGSFTHRNTTAQTFKVAQELAELYPDFRNFMFQIWNSHAPGHLLFKGIAINNIETFMKNTVAISTVPFQTLKEKGILTDDIGNDGIATLMRSVRGWEITVIIVERQEGVSYVSMRSRNGDVYDVSKIAAILGGGGHKEASGAYVNKKTPETKTAVLEAIKALYPRVEMA